MPTSGSGTSPWDLRLGGKGCAHDRHSCLVWRFRPACGLYPTYAKRGSDGMPFRQLGDRRALP